MGRGEHTSLAAICYRAVCDVTDLTHLVNFKAVISYFVAVDAAIGKCKVVHPVHIGLCPCI